MSYFVMVNTQDNKLLPFIDEDGCAMTFETEAKAIEAVEQNVGAVTLGYAVYENLNDFEPLEGEADSLLKPCAICSITGSQYSGLYFTSKR